jgi:PBS lyase HEAT-like repeat-containing protein
MLTLAACGRQTRDTIDDIGDWAGALAGQRKTVRDRLENVLRAHDRRDSASWPLLPGDRGESRLRDVLRDIEKIEEAEFADAPSLGKAMLLLAPLSERSESVLVRARAARAVARMGKTIPLESGPDARPITGKTEQGIVDLMRQAMEAAPSAKVPDTAAMRKERHAALLTYSSMRFWPPPSFDRPARGETDALVTGRKWSRTTIDFHYRKDFFARDIEDATVGPAIRKNLEGVTAEYARFTVAYALLRDDDSEVRYDAVASVLEMDSPDLLPVLSSAVRTDTRSLVRHRATRGIAELGKKDVPRAVRALAAALGDSSERVRHAAICGLRDLTGKDLGPEPEAWISWASESASPER